MSTRSMKVNESALDRAKGESQDLYKDTEIGTVPEDWNVKALGQLGRFKNGINKSKQDFGHGYPFVNLMDVFGIPKASTTTNSFGLVNSTPIERKLYDLRSGDVLFVRSSVKPEGVGLTTLVSKHLPETVFSGFLIRYRDNGELDPAFREHCFADENFRKRVIAASTVSANTNINQNALKRLKLGFPRSLVEQRAVSKALSDVDELRVALEALIAKDRSVKQATMQQLLTGRTRLPGFNGKWETRPLYELARITMGQSPSSRFYNSRGDGLPLIQGNADIEDRRTIERVWTTQVSKRCEAGTLLLTVRAPVGAVGIASKAACLGRGVCGLEPLGDKQYLFHALVFAEPRWRSSEQGSTFTSANSRQLGEFEVQIPQDQREQTAIASILSNMDDEITTLQARLDKTRAIKQGMMQQLLTGRIRLVKPQPAEAEA